MDKPTNFDAHLHDVAHSDPVEHRDYAVWCFLSKTEWLRPMDIGAWDGSWHSASLRRLVRKGHAVRRRRSTLMNAFNSSRGSYEYKAT